MDPAAPAPNEPGTGLTAYHRRLFALLTLATLFEGFDTALAQLALPVLGEEFGATRAELGLALSIAGIGMILAFIAIRAADRRGRRPILLVAVAGFALLTLATAFAPTLPVFTALQFGARFFLVTELALAYVVLSEELPPEIRGRANGWLGGFASVGAAIPMLLLAPLTEAGLGWRGLFALGAIPLLLWPVYWRVLREPVVFERRRKQAPAPPLRHELREWLRVLAPGVRARFAGAAALWWTVNFWSGSALYFFTIFAFQERGWTADHLTLLPWGMIPAGIAGYAASGWSMDRFGRRPTATAFLIASTIATILCFQAQSDLAIYLGYFAMVGLGGLWTIAATLSAELFPTELRATASGLANNIVGRTGIVIGPAASGALAETWGSIAMAVSALALVNLLCIPILWLTLPETRGIPLGEPAADEPS
jgi:putative MFS transporter